MQSCKALDKARATARREKAADLARGPRRVRMTGMLCLRTVRCKRPRQKSFATVVWSNPHPYSDLASNRTPSTKTAIASFANLLVVDRLGRQLNFIRELDKQKGVSRRISLIDRSRLENSAEHSWHLGTMPVVLAEYASSGTGIGRSRLSGYLDRCPMKMGAECEPCGTSSRKARGRLPDSQMLWIACKGC